LGLGQLAAQVLVLTGEGLDAACLGQGRVHLAAALLRCQGGVFRGGALPAPGRQVRGVDALAPQQRPDLARLSALVSRREDAELVGAAELAPLRHGHHLRIGARAG